MNEKEVIDRKIILKRQAIFLIKDEIWELHALLLRIKVKAIIKRLIVWSFSHKLIGHRTAQRIYNLLRLKTD